METVLRSRKLTELGFKHGFSLRCPQNLASALDSENRPALNYEAIARAIGYAPADLYEVAQEHGAAVEVIGPGAKPQDTRMQPADALVACNPPAAVGVRVADCLALLLADPDSGAVAAIHAGWRGVATGVVGAGLNALIAQSSSRSERIRAAIFPHIRCCCFEVGEDVAKQLAAISPDLGAVYRRQNRFFADLSAIVRAQLLQKALAQENIDDVGGCTRCDSFNFFSYRREAERCGRHLAAIVVRR